MESSLRQRTLFIVFALVALLVYTIGWSAFSFLTDDAYIAFRYVGNRQLGNGYVWNAPPFAPVEGYTSFLWIVLLDGVWSLAGIEPPKSANALSFVLGLASLSLTAFTVWRLQLKSALVHWKVLLTAAALVALLSNVSFLTWNSSGLETGLFNFLVLAWVAACLLPRVGSPRWYLLVSSSAGLLALTRPDGLLHGLATLALLGSALLRGDRKRRSLHAACCLPLLMIPVHLLWRHSFYGEWLPNTYYAKHVAPWPESGWRYLASYLLEYAAWTWGVLAGAWLVIVAPRALRAGTWRTLLEPRNIARCCVVATVLAHLGYYVVSIGGDHFEYRVFSHSIPLQVISSIIMLDGLASHRRRGVAVAGSALATMILLALPLPWSYAYRGAALTTREETKGLCLPMETVTPAVFRWYVRPYDRLQKWLIDRLVCRRRQEHAVFEVFQRRNFPFEREVTAPIAGDHAVLPTGMVGVPGWLLGGIHMIDVKGLNDYVIARTPTPLPDGKRRMAHDRFPPQGYVECFRRNVYIAREGIRIRERVRPVTPEEICDCEERFRPNP
jgi:arabinofuranosyltransferase